MSQFLLDRRVLAGLLCCVISVLTALSHLNSAEPDGSAETPAIATPAAGLDGLTPGDVDLKTSRVYVYVGKTGLGHEHAVAGALKSGSLQLGATENAGQLVFDMKTFQADSDTARRYLGLSGSTDAGTRQQVDANMLGPAVLNVARFRTATFVVASATAMPQKSRRGLPQYQLTGNFTLHGVTRPIQFVADAETKDGWIRVRGSFSLLQTQFGIQPFSKAFGAIGVTDQLTIHGDLWLADASAARAASASATTPK